ncbi:MAG TPA: right-handed parallel beta-helix repeat-containing protein [Pyrinomonadaceae bacterium]|nr:right-handed parallel beta-helix repeat-containing protein [Pyrinomonadaceae bacterium]
MRKSIKKIVPLILLTLAFGVSAKADPRVYVTMGGSDQNPCTQSSPCRTITHALNVVDAGGEVVVAESGDYDQILVGRSVTIAAAPGVNAGIVMNTAAASVIANSQPTDSVTFRNLNFKSTAPNFPADGIINVSAGTLVVEGCTFSGFGRAISMSVPGQLYVHDTRILACDTGVSLGMPLTITEGLLNAVIDHCRIEQSTTMGMFIASRVMAHVRDSVIAGGGWGVRVLSNRANNLAEAELDNCQISGNTTGIFANTTNGGFSSVRLSRNVITRNNTGVAALQPNTTVVTMQNNVIEANGTNVNGALTPANLK